MPQPPEPMTAVSLVSLAVLCVLALKKLFAADRFHALRVVILTAILWAAVLYLFGLAYPDDPFAGDCFTFADAGVLRPCTET